MVFKEDKRFLITIQSNEKIDTNFVCSNVLLKNATAFFYKTYRELYNYKLLDTIFNSKAVTLLLKTTRSDG